MSNRTPRRPPMGRILLTIFVLASLPFSLLLREASFTAGLAFAAVFLLVALFHLHIVIVRCVFTSVFAGTTLLTLGLFLGITPGPGPGFIDGPLSDLLLWSAMPGWLALIFLPGGLFSMYVSQVLFYIILGSLIYFPGQLLARLLKRHP
ncbi:MAG TPA: hypothetical protein P5279_17690 [Anaerohalosphaeraceae bacterium]|jgi:hypothetical protein|nr:hypothetical protein [Anaerohalosphaeraceae bacterium]HRT52325.1 hypothetical protein [Anaerohalosphaeraceae bacterium]HRT88330.1 hypothetical protein [Anaerohalosphaeraceae bacterium]